MPASEQLVDEPVVEVESLAVERSGAVRLDPRPGEGEAVGVDAEGAHQLDVLGGAVVVVAGDGGGVAVLDAAGLLDEGVPAGGPAAAGREGAFNLERGRGNSQLEIRAQARGQGLNCYGILHSHAPIIPTAPAEGNERNAGPAVVRAPACTPVRGAGTTRDRPLIRFCPLIPAY